MLNVVIVGAGKVGTHIASVLSKEEHNIILIDTDKDRLNRAAEQMDVATRLGSGTDWQLLDDLLELSPHVFMSLTSHDETNLAACAIAKHLGYPKTIARVRGGRFLNRSRLDFSRIFDVDYFVSPELLAANQILQYLNHPGYINVETFAHGAVELRTVEIPKTWDREDRLLSKLQLPEGIMVGLIYRRSNSDDERVIFPHGDTRILKGDEVTFIGETEAMSELLEFIGFSQKRAQSAVIVGGSLTGLNLAKLLEAQKIETRIIEKNYDRCVTLAEKVPDSVIIYHDASDYEFLLSEKVGAGDVIICCTSSDESNLMIASLGKRAGCEQAIVLLLNPSYKQSTKMIGIDYAVFPREIITNHILSQLYMGKVASLVSMYENSAEILEINVSADSKLVGIPLSTLGRMMPRNFLFAVIQNRGRIMIANGNRILSPGDTVVVITDPQHVNELEKIF